jgi:hypothetical protein
MRFAQIFSCSIRFLEVGFLAQGYDFKRKGRRQMARNGNGRHYEAVNRADVPEGRKGKHRKAVTDILADLSKLKAQQAIKIPLSSVNGEKMQNLRSALNRVTREKNIPVLTSSDEKYLYVWRADPPKNTEMNE